ncbi:MULTISPECIES: VOC family protein [unclassified Rhodococcus (in: high G+C Gram-positive bacteria)]|uniref:VOC family protein n=1 Tax=unclassified Rhodococcus (in: high G+C Gram-positive bacteria) TaxID=192944 RepID=UPI0024B713EB|nr:MULTISPECIES: VOC family protein [unclassified Rhodococcus (in: high G+C Gram-positive bacteria)]MDI9957422.1 VOC family protein [Rhodococcus sp. IEGM 1237]MDI9962876.1 VOC family protein [Rhodococcus sp. IEGM 1251]MDV8125226.1 VOC family protein [Rhodococcus sp. IEGM 1304]
MEILSSRTILRPSEYERTLSFYRDTLGLAIAREYPGGTVFFAGQGLIEVAAHGGTGEGGFRGAIWLQVRDLTAVQTELVLAGVKIAREARQEPWGLHEMWIADPDGTPIVMVQIPEDHPFRKDSRPPAE